MADLQRLTASLDAAESRVNKLSRRDGDVVPFKGTTSHKVNPNQAGQLHNHVLAAAARLTPAEKARGKKWGELGGVAWHDPSGGSHKVAALNLSEKSLKGATNNHHILADFGPNENAAKAAASAYHERVMS